MSLRWVLGKYRLFQYRLFGRNRFGIMPKGIECLHEPFQQEINHGDVVHPCVRYIPRGYEGHKWWMVYTPYYSSNAKTENPILCYSDDEGIMPPSYWKVYCLVKRQPNKGYNSDPNLLYANHNLYVFWRENETEQCYNHGFKRATFGGVVKDGRIVDEFGPLVGTRDIEADPQTCPTFLQLHDGTFTCLAMNLRFHSNIIKKLPKWLKQPVSSIALVADLLGFWSQQKSYGVSYWTSQDIDSSFRLNGTFKFLNKNVLYRPWHVDFFQYESRTYSIVQTNQCNADICLAVSDDGFSFKMYRKPLMTNETCGKVGIYKPTGGVISGLFYLYYTAQDKKNRKLNKLYLTTMEFSELLKKLQ